jgi:murein DD-endopeptidase MepM/ murein hydrolase activator NlpD
MIKLLRSCSSSLYEDGAQFGQWGKHWGYHFDDNGKWVKGQVKKDGIMCGQHGGCDIVVPDGVLQVCPADVETVIRAGWQDDTDHVRGYGLSAVFQLVPMEYAPGKFARLILTAGHLSEVWVKQGHHLAKGDAFGRSGNTGNSFGAHIHWQLELPDPVYPRTPLPFEWVNHF